jgi:hypothetical protein
LFVWHPGEVDNAGNGLLDPDGLRQEIELPEIFVGDDLVRTNVGNVKRLAVAGGESFPDDAGEKPLRNDCFSQTDLVGDEHAAAVALAEKSVVDGIDGGALEVLEDAGGAVREFDEVGSVHRLAFRGAA